jgi:hypothetical protein
MIAHILVVIFLLFVAIGGFYSVRLFKKWLERKDSSFVISVMEVVIFWSSIVYLHQIKEQDIPSKVFIFVTTWIGLKTLNHPTQKTGSFSLSIPRHYSFKYRLGFISRIAHN